MTVTSRDLGIGELQKSLERLRTQKVTIGVQGTSGARRYPDPDSRSDVTVAQVAAFHEFGTADMPARPFMRVMFATRKADIAAAGRKMLSDVIDGRATENLALATYGETLVKFARDTIDRAGSWAMPLEAATLKYKRTNATLRETDFMRNSVSYAVRVGGKIVRQGGEQT